MDTAAVEAAIARGAILWDVRSEHAYRKGHLAGAVNIGHAASVLRNPNTEDYIATEKIEAILGAAGIDPNKEIVVYATRGSSSAYFGQLTLRYFGATGVSVYHDGIDGWRSAGKAISTQPSSHARVSIRLTPRAALLARTEDVIAAGRRGDVQLIDTRTPAEFAGEDVRAIRGGHIPGAINIPYEQNWVDPDTSSKVRQRLVRDNAGAALKSTDALKALYGRLDRDKETIVYCQSGVRAAQTAAVLASLGFSKVKVYDSSWLGYASRLDAPAEKEVFVNIGALRGELAGVRTRLDQIEQIISRALSSR